FANYQEFDPTVQFPPFAFIVVAGEGSIFAIACRLDAPGVDALAGKEVLHRFSPLPGEEHVVGLRTNIVRMAGYLHLYVRVLLHHPLELVQLVIGFILEGPLVKVEIDVSQYTAYTHGKLAKGYGPVDRLGFRSGARKPYRFVNEDITIQLNREPIFFFLRPGDGKVGDAVTGT